MEKLIEFLPLFIGFIYLVLKDIWRERKEDRLLNRLMAKDYREYKYYEDLWKKEIDLTEARRKQELQKPKGKSVEIDFFNANTEKEPDFEEDWSEEELELEKDMKNITKGL